MGVGYFKFVENLIKMVVVLPEYLKRKHTGATLDDEPPEKAQLP